MLIKNNLKAVHYDPEIMILEEVPYNWKKHFIHQLPEMFSFIARMFIWYFALVFFFGTFLVTVISSTLNLSVDEIEAVKTYIQDNLIDNLI